MNKKINLILCFLVFFSCSGKSEDTKSPAAKETLENLSLKNQGPSLYDLELEFRDQNNQKTSLDHYRNHPVVMTLFYASCDYSCPLLLDALKKMKSQLSPQAKKETKFFLISMDPKNDTPAKLKKRLDYYQFSPQSWKMVVGSDSALREVAAAMDIIYRENKQGGFHHSSRLVLLDRDGQIIKNIEGIGDAAEQIKTFLNQKFPHEKNLP